jgi:predicted phosphoribosyltransferase
MGYTKTYLRFGNDPMMGSNHMRPKVIDEPAYRERTYVFRDRIHAGQLLAEKIRNCLAEKNILLLAIPAGGVPVACTISQILSLPVEVIVVRKIQIPWNTEAGFGAISWNGEVVLNDDLVAQLGLTKATIQNLTVATKKIIDERLKKFRKDKPLPSLKGKTVIIIDDGLASGFTMLAAVKSAKRAKPSRIIVAIPTASLRAVELLLPGVDELICLNVRSGPMFAVADAYRNWYDLTDEEVIEFLKKQRPTL